MKKGLKGLIVITMFLLVALGSSRITEAATNRDGNGHHDCFLNHSNDATGREGCLLFRDRTDQKNTNNITYRSGFYLLDGTETKSNPINVLEETRKVCQNRQHLAEYQRKNCLGQLDCPYYQEKQPDVANDQDNVTTFEEVPADSEGTKVDVQPAQSAQGRHQRNHAGVGNAEDVCYENQPRHSRGRHHH